MPRRYPGLVSYLKLEMTQRERYNRSQYDARAREAAEWALRYLILFSQRQKEEEVAKVVDKRIVELFKALTGHGCETISARHYLIAMSMTDIGADCLTKLIPPAYLGLVNDGLQRGLMPLRMARPPADIHNAVREVEREDLRKSGLDLG